MTKAKTIVTIISIVFASAVAPQLALAKGGKAPARNSSMEQSKKFKIGKDHTSVDFDDASIEGQAKNPFGSMLNSRDQDFNKGFIKLRYNWHDQMLISASGMSQ